MPVNNHARTFLTRIVYFTGTGPSDSNPNSDFLCFNESPLKMIKNAFHFISKALLILRICKFLLRFFGHVEKTTELKQRVEDRTSKFMTSKRG